MHGRGDVVNPIVGAFAAARMAGYAGPTGWRPPDADMIDWPESGSEVDRLLALTDHLGMPRAGTGLDFPLCADDRAAAEPLLRPLRGRPLAIVHPGSQLASRRWPPERFAAVADALAAAGLVVALTGSAGEAGLTRTVARAMHAPALDCAGLTTLWTLGAMVERAALVVCNDTGISHVAAALGTRSVVVSSGGDVQRWSPADASRHRVLWHDVPCRPCAHAHCPIGHPCALAVGVDDVRRAALQSLGGGSRPPRNVVGPAEGRVARVERCVD
jgi:ADP-heptose:LPS heptosyltransferase